MRARRLGALAMPIAVLAGSQVGHLLTTELRQGPRALSPDHTGIHAYVPALSTVAFGAAGAAVLAALMIVAAARVARAGQDGIVVVDQPRRGSVLDLAASLFVLQLAVYLGQETCEAAVRGSPLPSVGDLLLLGSLGQLPAALLATLVLRWLTAHLRTAIVELSAVAGRPLGTRPALSPARLWLPPAPARPSGPGTRTTSERGPPPLLPLRLT